MSKILVNIEYNRYYGRFTISGEEMGMDIREQIPGREEPEGCKKNAQQGKRPFISIYWKCCKVYSRIYKNLAGTAYEGSCPGCGGHLSLPIGEGGTNQRSFVAQ